MHRVSYKITLAQEDRAKDDLNDDLCTWALGGPILKKCFQNFPPDPYITLYICKTENPGV